MSFFVDNKTIGLFEQGDTWCPVGDFVRMRNWVLSHLMWNPSLDENKLFDEFLTGYYGKKAAPFLSEYLDVLSDRVANLLKEEGRNAHYEESTDDWLDYETLCRATTLMDNTI